MKWWQQFLPLSYEQLGHLAYNLGTCLSAGIALPRAFRTTTQSLAKSDSSGWLEVADRLDHNESFSDALRAIEGRLPPFFIPLIAAGEETGRLDEVLHYLSDHFRLLARPTRALRNVWLGPLLVYLVSIPLKLLMLLWFGAWSSVGAQMVDAVASIGSLIAIAFLLLAPPLKPAWDRLRVVIPVLGQSEREVSLSRFLRIFSMLYGTGAMRVENMIRFAARSVTNDFFQRDLLRAAKRVEQSDNLAQAFSNCITLNSEEKQTIASGELSGTLEAACQRLASNLDEVLEARLKVVTNIAMRVTMFVVTMSVVGLVLNLVTMAVLKSL
jgi:type IV pilus assembly protein PilC